MTYYDAEIEYLESTSTQWIDTEIIPDATTGFEIKVVCSNNYDTYFIGLRNDSGKTRWGAGHSNYGFYWCYGNYQSSGRLSGTSATVKLNYLNDKKYVATNGSNTVDVLLPTLSFTPAYNIRLFGSAGVDASYSKWSGKIYYCQITQGSELIMDLIPVRIGSVGYLYDKVSDKLFGNAGTGSFTLGPDVAGWPGVTGKPKVSELRRKILTCMPPKPQDPITELEYIEITGAGQYISLDVIPDITTDACEMLFQLTTNVPQGLFFYSNKLYIYVSGSNNFAFNRYTGADNWQLVYATNVGTVKRKWKTDYLNKLVYVDDYPVYTMTGTLQNPATVPNNIILFTHPSYLTTRNLKAKIFHVKYWKNGELIRDMVPARQGTIGGMYDKITGTFYTNAGTGEFVLGRDRYTKLNKYVLPDYIMSEGSRLDTRFLPNGNSRVVLDVWCRSSAFNNSWEELFGSRVGDTNAAFTFQTVCVYGNLYNMCPRDVYGNNVVYLTGTNALDFTKDRVIVDKDKGNTTVTKVYNDTVIHSNTRATQTFNSKYPLLLGGINQNATAYGSASGRGSFFSFKVYDNDTLIRDYIPAIHPDGTVGFFESIEKHFYPSDGTVSYRAGYVHTSNEGHKFVFFNTGITDSLDYSRNDSDLLSSLIPVKTRRIKVNKDSTYTTKVIEYGCRKIIKKGGHEIISSDSTGDVIELSTDCDNIAILVEGCPFNYDPQVDIIDVGTPNYLTLTALEDGTFTFTIGSTITTTQYQYIEYSVDSGTTWIKTNNVANTTITITTPTITTGNKVLWRGVGQRTSNNNSNTTTVVCKFSSTGKFDVSGNIMSILYGEDFAGENSTPTADNYTFRCLFYNSKVVHAHELCLPIFYMKYAGYEFLLGNCHDLISVPKLHSVKLNTYCYVNMFNGCTSLNTLPYLPAKYLAQYCYAAMFRNCTSLTTIGTIMPTLTNLVSSYVFSYMFTDCTSLIDASGLTLNILGVNYAAQYMFSGCIALITPPIISATSASAYCCYHMFQNCTSLVTAPTLPATSLGSYCYSYMFSGCSSLVNAPALPATTLQTYCYVYMFQNCTSLVTAPALPALTVPTNAYGGMFAGCTSLVNAPALPAFSVSTYGYSSMFSGCSSLTVAPELPAMVLDTYAYNDMFTETAITTAPALPEPIIPTNAYKNMFRNCNNLNYIKCTAADISATDCTLEWTVDGTDTTLSGVSSTGIFIQRAGVTWPTGVSGIPEGWTIIYLNPEDGKYYTDSECTILWSNAPELPYTSKIEYLLNDGTTARIKTCLNYTNMDKYEIKFKYDSWSSYAYIMGNYLAEAANTIRIILNNTDSGKLLTYFNTKASGGSTIVSAAKGEDHIITAEHNVSVIIDGEEVPITNTTTNTANRNLLTLFAANSTNTTILSAQRRIYYFKAWYNGTLMRNLIPVRVGTEGAMYDLASGELLENPMSGVFILGSDI